MMRNTLIASLILLCVGASIALIFQPSLDRLHAGIEKEHDEVLHISANDYQALDPQNVVVFDVREEAEYEVSHLAGAIQISPGIDALEFAEDFSELLAGKTAVFYCSVGRRSSDTLARLSPVLRSASVKSAANLKGGIFNWANQNKELVGDHVHPYNQYWGRLIEDQSKVSYSPATTK